LGKLSKRGTKQAFNVATLYQYSNDRPVPVMCYKTIIMPFNVRVKYHTFIHVVHTLNGNAPAYLNDMFQFALNSHYSLRSGNNKSLRQLKPNTATCILMKKT